MRFKTAAAWAVVVLVVGGLGVLAGWAAFAPPAVDQEPVQDPEYTVREATVGREISMTASASWPRVNLPAGAAEGTVTAVGVTAGQEVAAGGVLYEVDLRPVVVAEGETPGFRDLSRGARGRDVSQLQELLVEAGYDPGAIDGRFGVATERALRSWQHDLGLEDDGRLAAGDVQYAPSLPARVSLSDEIEVGARIAAGTVTTAVLAQEPSFELEFGDASTVPTTGTIVRIDGPDDHEWHAKVTEIRTDEGGAPAGAVLEAAEGGPVCADACEAVPVDADTSRYPAAVELAPAHTGPVVPLSAIGTTPVGEEFVVAIDGEELSIDILVTDGSRAVIEGLEVGDRIRLFAHDDPPIEVDEEQPAGLHDTSAPNSDDDE